MEILEKDQAFEKESSTLSMKVLLEPGDWLYIPSGWWHRAETKKESLHASLGVMPRSALDLLSGLPDFLAQDLFWRTRLPIHRRFESPEDERDFYRDAFIKLGKNLGEQFASEDFLNHALNRLRHPSKS